MISPPPISTFIWPPGKRAAVNLSFDDARPSQLDLGIPILDRHSVRATFYVEIRQMTPRLDGWKQAVVVGHEIGNHTVNHPCSGNFRWARRAALEEYTLDRMEAELAEANGQIEQLLGVRPRSFAYSCGQTFVGRGLGLQSYVPLVARHFEIGRGFRDEAQNDPGFCDLAKVAGTDFDYQSFDQIKAQIDLAAAQGNWLVLAGHGVGELAARQTVPVHVLDAVCRYCTDPANEIWIDTVATVGSYLRHVRSGSNQQTNNLPR